MKKESGKDIFSIKKLLPLFSYQINMGIYVHVPFCRSKCFYCGFYSVASLQLKENYVQSIIREIDIRADYLETRRVSTLYFGGGTPSYLDAQELEVITNKIHKTWDLDKDAECSIEMNPEDATSEKLSMLRKLEFNRLTIGIQTFNDRLLKSINRTHSSLQAIQSIENANNAGFENIGLDLIIGLPGSSAQVLEEDLKIISRLNIDHVSVYIVSIDSNSAFEKMLEKKKIEMHADDDLAEQYLMVSDYLKSIGYEHYEISNFAKNCKYSKHNISYWQQKAYIGLGPSAHSFDLKSRQWNISHIKKYIDSLDKGVLLFEKEELTSRDIYNEYLMTNLRTMWGIEYKLVEKEFPQWWSVTRKKMNVYCNEGLMCSTSDRIRLTEKGWLLSDGIFCELFV